MVRWIGSNPIIRRSNRRWGAKHRNAKWRSSFPAKKVLAVSTTARCSKNFQRRGGRVRFKASVSKMEGPSGSVGFKSHSLLQFYREDAAQWRATRFEAAGTAMSRSRSIRPSSSMRRRWAIGSPLAWKASVPSGHVCSSHTASAISQKQMRNLCKSSTVFQYGVCL